MSPARSVIVRSLLAFTVIAASLAQAQAPPAHVAPYDWLASHLPRYRELAAKTWPGPVPSVKKLSPGDAYPGTATLTQILRDLGDLPESAAAPADGTYGGALVDAVKAFQRRHGLTPDGVIGASTLSALNQPYSARLRQIEQSLEWLGTIVPPETDSIIIVNIPAFQLHAWSREDRGKKATLSMPVVVGRAARSSTPILVEEMEHVIFRPYWYVPRGITMNEMMPKLAKDPAYLDKQDIELTASGDDNAPGLPATPENIAKVRAGSLSLRQKPGPGNALGRVKFIFPNSESVYLHDTPAQSGFTKDRRDFSHGCVRVSNPAALAEFVLRNVPGWDRARIDKAMAAERPEVAKLPVVIPVWLVYSTAVAGADGTLGFYDNIYSRDAPAGGKQR